MDKENKVREQYDRLASIYDDRWFGYVASSLSILEQRIKLEGHENILDVACGTGSLEQLLLARFPDIQITGIDISDKMLSVARSKLKTYPAVAFTEASSSELPFPAESFDWVVCASAFHYFDNVDRSLSEMRRVLKTGGKIIILDWCHDYLVCRICDVGLKLFDPAYTRCYSQKELRDSLERAQFYIEIEDKIRFRLIWGMMIAEAVK
jgi:ubiquinone/menaquinone biosynthesis C-methylase UbiE